MKRKIIIPIILIFYSCSFPKIIIIEDALTAKEHNDLGVIYLKQGKFEFAEREFLRAIKKEPQWDLPYFNLGNTHYISGHFDKAEKLYRKTLELNPENTDAMNNLAYLLMERSKINEAKKLIEKAISINPKEEYLDTLKRIEKKKQNELF